MLLVAILSPLKSATNYLTFTKAQVIDLGDETDGSYSIEMDGTASTTKQKKTYTNGAVAAILDASGTNVVIKKEAKGADYEKVVITFDYKVVSGTNPAKLYIKANDKAFADQYPYIIDDAKTEDVDEGLEGSKTVTVDLDKTKNLTSITFGFNNHEYKGASTDSFKIVIRKIELTERKAIDPSLKDITVDLSGKTVKNTTAFENAYESFDVTFDAVNLTSYKFVKPVVKFYGANGTSVVNAGWGYGMYKLLDGDKVVAEQYNLGMQNMDVSEKELSHVTGIRLVIQTPQGATTIPANYIELVSLTFTLE